MGRLWFLRRPLILFGVLGLVGAVLVATGTLWDRHKKAAFDACVNRSLATMTAPDPQLARQVQQVHLEQLAHLQSGPTDSHDVGLWSSPRPIDPIARTLASRLTNAGFHNVTVVVEPGLGRLVRAETGNQRIDLYVRSGGTSGEATRVFGRFGEIPPRCS
jgi:hypothetical protein